ncbi:MULTISPECIES: LytR/AlgR family response regulator transcription factor [Galbibacter]|uniref:LytTR family DNA-binding domain-containing protein n=1 Tax=Galbibacter pacificus TaxID=2996052 RepID=A0ABT6FUW2_9FLAO|nr:LytTR family DNA-binding domain-containing protein [Galbibacter pacificus]MDG3583460.1 LytTR family DNA-binding domain-containing protein [Galbibacter pacificus]MDG3587063.1 LytTR family DNA-binding domain-containing protein [Galbibacter pacificus]
MNIKCLIIDDEPLAVDVIKSYIEEFKNMEIVGAFNNPINALQVLENQEIDVIFLDINMPKMNGLEFLRNLKEHPLVIVTTAYREYAIESYELEVLDYLVKPIPFNRFLKSMNKLTARLMVLNGIKQTVDFDQDPHVFLKVDKKLIKIFLHDILYIESLKDYIKLHSREGTYISHKSLSSISEELPSENFIRVHKSYTIAIDKVKSIEGNLIEIENKKIPIGRNYAKYAKERILKNKGNFLSE